MSSEELWNYDYTHLPTVESSTHSRYRWVLDAPEIPLELSDKSQALLKRGRAQSTRVVFETASWWAIHSLL